MTRKFRLALMLSVGALAFPALIGAVAAQEPPSAPTPSEATQGGGMSKGDMSKGGDMKPMKKMKHSSKKKKHM